MKLLKKILKNAISNDAEKKKEELFLDSCYYRDFSHCEISEYEKTVQHSRKTLLCIHCI